MMPDAWCLMPDAVIHRSTLAQERRRSAQILVTHLVILFRVILHVGTATEPMPEIPTSASMVLAITQCTGLVARKMSIPVKMNQTKYQLEVK
jgi:hypothetical protein